MNDCCVIARTRERASELCPLCGSRGRPVSPKTLDSLLKPEERRLIRPGPYYFDRMPTCPVVYFSNETDSYFTKGQLVERVGIKESLPPIPICYCFGHTLESARQEILETGYSTVAARITAEIRAGRCACEVKNPSGGCCLGEVRKAVSGIQKELLAGSLSALRR